MPTEQPLVCENYELTFGEGKSGVVLTFELDDLLPAIIPTYVDALRITKENIEVDFRDESDPDGYHVTILFPLNEAMEEAVALVRDDFKRLFVAGLGDVGVAFAREMLLD